MAFEKDQIDTDVCQLTVFEPDNKTPKASIDTIGVDIGGFSGYITEITPMLPEHQESIIRSLGGAAISSLGIDHSTLLFTKENARNLFPIPENVNELNSFSIGQAIIDLFFTDYQLDIPF